MTTAPRPNGAQALPAFGAGAAGTESPIDIDRFMGTWYVIAHLPTLIDRRVVDAVEHYRRNDDGSITVCRDYSDTKTTQRRSCKATGRVVDSENGRRWSLQYLWPLRTAMRIDWVDDAYRYAIVGGGRPGQFRVLARTPSVAPDTFFELVQIARNYGFAAGNLRTVPQRRKEIYDA